MLAAIFIGRVQTSKLEHIELHISTGEPRLMDSWHTTISKMFLGYLLQAYPSLYMGKLVYEPQTTVVWAQPSGALVKGVAMVETVDLWVEKQDECNLGYC